jgi:hypothetical protein
MYGTKHIIVRELSTRVIGVPGWTFAKLSPSTPLGLLCSSCQDGLYNSRLADYLSTHLDCPIIPGGAPEALSPAPPPPPRISKQGGVSINVTEQTYQQLSQHSSSATSSTAATSKAAKQLSVRFDSFAIRLAEEQRGKQASGLVLAPQQNMLEAQDRTLRPSGLSQSTTFSISSATVSAHH